MCPDVFCEGGGEREVAAEGHADAGKGVMSEGGGAEGLGEVVSLDAWGDGVVVQGLGDEGGSGDWKHSAYCGFGCWYRFHA